MTRTIGPPSPTTGLWLSDDAGTELQVRRVRLEVAAGPDAGRIHEIGQPVIRIGRTPANDVVLADGEVSRVHAEIVADERGFRLRDLGSSNGVYVSGVRLLDGYVPPGCTLSIGRTELRFQPLAEGAAVALDDGAAFPHLIGASLPMRRLFAAMRRIAATDATVLITGETGSGKEVIAASLHQASPRHGGPFVVADCSAIAPTLFEAEMFGHERGAFSGATAASAGLFERAHGGTLFLDEIGELPLELQPELLRAVQSREVRRVGGSRAVPCDVRLVAATRRNLAIEINRGTFRDDLYFRLAVAELEAPPLRERGGDIGLLIDHFVARIGGAGARLPDATRRAMLAHPWPGNVRELRDAVERALVLPGAPPLAGAALAGADRVYLEVDTTRPFREAKQQLIDEFDRRVLEALLERHEGNIAEAARATGLDRVSIYKIMGRLGMTRPR